MTTTLLVLLAAIAATHATASSAGAASSSAWSLQGRTALVTGGSKGIGRAVVEELLAQGVTVLTCARSAADLDSLTSELGPDDNLHVLRADVSTTRGQERLLKGVEQRLGGRLDILVNNVGTNVRKQSEDYSDDEYQWMMRTNLDSAFHLSRKCLAFLRQSSCKGGGCVINVSSISGSTVDSTGAPYHMAKAAMEHMTRYQACEWAPLDVRVNCVAPWFIKTALTEPILHGSFADAVHHATPMGRVGETQEVARVVSFLCMDAASYVTGQVLQIDGGFTCLGFKYVAPSP